MNVQDVMMRTPASCSLDTNLGSAVEILWNRNCGMLPVLDAEGRVAGVITDRDICIALGTRSQTAGEIAVQQAISGRLIACRPEDDVRAALAAMGNAKVRRLPVVDPQGKLLGILSMDDVVLHANASVLGRPPELSHDEVMEALKQVYRSNLPEMAPRSAAAA